MQLSTRAFAALVTVAALSLPAIAGAQELPTVSEILDRHVAAIGGKDAVQSITSIEQRGTLDMPAMGISAEVVIAMAKPNKSAMTMSIPGIGEVQQGYNGEVAWGNDPMQGPRIAEGEELAARQAAANFEEAFGLYDMEKFSSVKVVAKALYGGEDAYKVEFVRKVGPTVLTYYSIASGLYIGSQTSVASPMGNVEVNAVASDYKQFGKLKLPTRIAQSQAGQDVLITLSDVTFDTVKDDTFALPPAIQALIKP